MNSKILCCNAKQEAFVAVLQRVFLTCPLSFQTVQQHLSREASNSFFLDLSGNFNMKMNLKFTVHEEKPDSSIINQNSRQS